MGVVAGAAIAAAGVLLSGYLTGQAQKEAAEIQAEGYTDAQQMDINWRNAEVTRLTESLGIAREEADAIVNEQLGGYAESGQTTHRMQMALSGALGPAAQRQAYAAYEESPGVAWQREQGQRGIAAGLSARGGLGGGSRLRALSEFNQGLATQDFNNQWNRLGAITDRGFNASTNMASILTQNAFNAVPGSQGVPQSQAANIANAQAQGILGQAQTYNNTVNQLASLYGYYNQNNQQQNGQYPQTQQPQTTTPYYNNSYPYGNTNQYGGPAGGA